MVNFKHIHIITSVLLALLFFSCESEPIDHTKIVVEGWIDAGKHPVVMLHTSYSLNAAKYPDSTKLLDILEEHMVLFGRVVISDGEDSAVLIGRMDTNYLPPYIYTTTQIRGEEGKIYTLQATYKDYVATSTSEIYDRAQLDSISVTQHGDKMNVVGYANDLEIGAPYILMARLANGKQYKICPMGAFRATKRQMAMTINNPLKFADENMMLQTLFPKLDELISIKFARIGEAEFLMWDSYIAQNLTQGLFFMETHSNISSNIQGGNGYWCGMGASEYTIRLSGERTYVFEK